MQKLRILVCPACGHDFRIPVGELPECPRCWREGQVGNPVHPYDKYQN